MSYGPDYVREDMWQNILWGGFAGAVAFGVVMILLIYLQKRDEELHVEISEQGYIGLLFLCACMGCGIFIREQGELLGILKGALMLTYLILCSITDMYMQQVYDRIQLYVCLLLAVGILFGTLPPALGGELIAFGIVQCFLFRRMYGDGDVMGFLICALSLIEKGIMTWIMHMALAYILLGIVQGYKGNIGRDGNLRKPVAFFPYMACAYILVF